MNVTKSGNDAVLIIEPSVFKDARGLFYESYNRRDFAAATGVDVEFVQDSHSVSEKNVLRGLHYQLHRPQGKLVRVVAGCVFDVALDLRRHSPTFGTWTGLLLSAENRRQVWIPPGFAHGFIVTSDSAEFLYKSTEYWAPEFERCIRWDDPALAIDWPFSSPPSLSPKDRAGKLLADAEVYA